MPNSRHSPAIFSPSSTRATNFSLSSMGLHTFQGICALRKSPNCVTHVLGMKCHPSLRKGKYAQHDVDAPNSPQLYAVFGREIVFLVRRDIERLVPWIEVAGRTNGAEFRR